MYNGWFSENWDRKMIGFVSNIPKVVQRKVNNDAKDAKAEKSVQQRQRQQQSDEHKPSKSDEKHAEIAASSAMPSTRDRLLSDVMDKPGDSQREADLKAKLR